MINFADFKERFKQMFILAGISNYEAYNASNGSTVVRRYARGTYVFTLEFLLSLNIVTELAKSIHLKKALCTKNSQLRSDGYPYLIPNRLEY